MPAGYGFVALSSVHLHHFTHGLHTLTRYRVLPPRDVPTQPYPQVLMSGRAGVVTYTTIAGRPRIQCLIRTISNPYSHIVTLPTQQVRCCRLPLSDQPYEGS